MTDPLFTHMFGSVPEDAAPPRIAGTSEAEGGYVATVLMTVTEYHAALAQARADGMRAAVQRSDAVAVCAICDIAGCHHLRAAKADPAHSAVVDRLQALAEETRKTLNGVSASDADVFEAAARILAALAPAPAVPADAGLDALVAEWADGWRQCGCSPSCYGRHDERNAVLEDVVDTLIPSIAALRARQTTAPVDTAGWIISDGQDARWRTLGEYGEPIWTDNRDAALRFARKVDAEMFSREDEDAWLIKPFAALTPAPVGVPSFVQIIMDKLRRFEEVADDVETGGVDIGRGWLDLLTTLGLLDRVQRSPALWRMTDAAAAALHPPRDAPTPAPQVPPEVLRQVVEALRGWETVAAHCEIGNGVCCCGDSMDGHSNPMECGHTPVDKGAQYADATLAQTIAALAAVQPYVEGV